MPKTDLILMHAPSVYDFRQKAMMLGPVSDVVPSTQVFEMYPIGFLPLMAHLERHGHSVRIINVALRMLRSKSFRAERLLKKLKPVAFGIDLHWLVHAQGSLELAKLIKELHPTIPIIFGGLSSSYFHEELIRYPQVDYVVRGDSAEEPLRQLMDALQGQGSLADVPNLTWKEDGLVRVNALSHVPSDMNAASFDYRQIIKSCARSMDVLGHLPFLAWLDYPIVAGLSCRGCVHNCVTCGGSASAFDQICHRSQPAFRDPKLLANDIGAIARHIRGPAMTLGDPMQAGIEYAEAFFDALAELKLSNHMAIEFFAPPPRRLLEKVANSVSHFNIQISPESHDEEVRAAFGRRYSNERLERFIEDALELGCHRVDLFFMVGLPKQTPQSVRNTVRYCETLLQRYGHYGKGRLDAFISPLAPFLDPGSPAFEDPDRYGYRLFHRTLEEHRQALLAPSWKYTLNYETVWMSRDELVDSVYESALELNRVKQRFGLTAFQDAQQLEARIQQEWQIVHALDGIATMPDTAERERQVRDVLQEFSTVGEATICGRTEMNWPTRFLRFDPLRILREVWSKT